MDDPPYRRRSKRTSLVKIKGDPHNTQHAQHGGGPKATGVDPVAPNGTSECVKAPREVCSVRGISYDADGIPDLEGRS